jgi:hypothetical protein
VFNKTVESDQRKRAARAAVLSFICASLLTIAPIAYHPAHSQHFSLSNFGAKHKRPVSPYKIASVAAYRPLQDRLANKNGWIGSDAAYSIPLAPDRSLWLFGDTFVGKVVANKRVGSTMIHNSIAIEERGGGSKAPGKFSFHYRTDARARPTSFFDCLDKGDYYWPGDGFMRAGKLYLFMHVVHTDLKLPPPYQFELRTDHLVIVDNPQDDPTRWRYQIKPLKSSAKRVLYGVACLDDAKYHYIFCANGAVGLDFYKHPASLARLAKGNKSAFSTNNLEWWSGEWLSHYELPETLFEDAASEMSISRVPGCNGYFAFYIPADKKAVMMRHAAKLEGPWSERETVCALPPGLPGTAPLKNTADMLYYSAKVHPQYSANNEVVITYCTNSSSFEKLSKDASVYFPQSLKVKLAPRGPKDR